MKRITKIQGLSPAVGAYSLATINGDTVYTAGQIGLAIDNTLVTDSIEAETHQVMMNLAKILEAAGTNFTNVLKVTIYLTDISDFARVNEIYATYFSQGEYPVRETTVAAALPLGAHIEISMIAAL